MLTALPLVLIGCSSSFEFEVQVVLFEADMVVVIDGQARSAVSTDSYDAVIISETFSSYEEGLSLGKFEVKILKGEQPILEQTFVAGHCPRDTGVSEWEHEVLFVSTTPENLGLSGYECRSGKVMVMGVF